MKNQGFTLVELVIVIVIVGILSIVAVPIYRGYTRKSMLTEGKSLISAIEKQEKIYYVEFAKYIDVSATSFSPVLDIDARANKYFTAFQVTVSGSAFTAVTTGTGGATGIGVTLSSPDIRQKSVMTETGVSD
ncbi:MAG: prepilin-type N-terminal cleavage/methylation domain-containing protein [Endomicrobiaceae bacterium]